MFYLRFNLSLSEVVTLVLLTHHKKAEDHQVGNCQQQNNSSLTEFDFSSCSVSPMSAWVSSDMLFPLTNSHGILPMVADSTIPSCRSPSPYSTNSELVHTQQQRSSAKWSEPLAQRAVFTGLQSFFDFESLAKSKCFTLEEAQKALSTVVYYFERHPMALHGPDRIVLRSLIKKLGLSEKQL